jgi:hypothetical protein
MKSGTLAATSPWVLPWLQARRRAADGQKASVSIAAAAPARPMTLVATLRKLSHSLGDNWAMWASAGRISNSGE